MIGSLPLCWLAKQITYNGLVDLQLSTENQSKTTWILNAQVFLETYFLIGNVAKYNLGKVNSNQYLLAACCIWHPANL